MSAKAGKETGKETGAASLEFREELVRCPNCGKQNPAAAEVCTNCGYSRSLGRTLTTRVRSTEPEPAVKPAEKVSERGIAAEKEFATHKRRAAMNPLSDPFRIWAALLLCAAFAALVLALPKYPYQPPDIELHGRVFPPPEIRMQDALGYLAAIFLIATPLLTFVVRLLFLMMKNDNPAHLTSLRAAGSLALAQLVAVGFLFFQMTKLHLDPNTAALAFWGAIAVITFLGTWYLQNVRFLAAALVAIFTVVFAGLAVYLFSAFGLAAIKWMNL